MGFSPPEVTALSWSVSNRIWLGHSDFQGYRYQVVSHSCKYLAQKKDTTSSVWPILDWGCFSRNLRNSITESVKPFTTFCISCQITAYGRNKKLSIFWDTNRGRRNILGCKRHPRGLFHDCHLYSTVLLHHCNHERGSGEFSCLFLKSVLCAALTLSCKILSTLGFKSVKKDATPSAISSPTEDSNRMYLRAWYPAGLSPDSTSPSLSSVVCYVPYLQYL